MAMLQRYPIERRSFQIDDVDIPNRLCHVHDKTQGRIMVSFRNTGAAFQIPSPGEVWICERNTGHDWHLFRRRDQHQEHLDLQALSPGDTRVMSPGTIHLQGQALLFNGAPIGGGAFFVETFTAVGATTSKTVTNTPTGVGSITVFNNGVLIDPSSYGLAGKVVSFNSVATGHTIVISYS